MSDSLNGLAMMIDVPESTPMVQPLPDALRNRCLWLSWDNSRRSNELSRSLGVRLYVVRSGLPYLLRSVVLSIRTLFLLARRRPRLLVVQNPSMVLAGLTCLVRGLFGYRLVVNRHSTFYESEWGNQSIKWRLFHWLSRYTVRCANLTVVTNDELARLVAAWGGLAFVLPDKLPVLAMATAAARGERAQVVFASSHDTDEPVREVFEAASMIPEVEIHVTGDASASRARYSRLIAPNVHFTGYLPEPAYQSLLASADIIMALTTAPNTLLCCAYEAVSLAKPFIISDQEVLTRYFYKGRVVSDNTPEGIADAITHALGEAKRLSRESRELRSELRQAWGRQWEAFLSELASRCPQPGSAEAGQ